MNKIFRNKKSIRIKTGKEIYFICKACRVIRKGKFEVPNLRFFL